MLWDDSPLLAIKAYHNEKKELTGHVRIMISRDLVKLLKEYGQISFEK